MILETGMRIIPIVLICFLTSFFMIHLHSSVLVFVYEKTLESDIDKWMMERIE